MMLTLFHPSGWATTLIVALVALGIDAILGDPPALWARVPHPVAVIGKIIAAAERKLNRPQRTRLDRRLRGAGLVLGVVGACGGLGWGVSWLAAQGGWVWRGLELALVWSLLAQRSLYDHVAAVGTALVTDGLRGGRDAVSRIVGRDPESLDEAGVVRAAIESCAENFADGVVAPVFWLVVLGPAGLLIYKAANTFDSMIGHRSDRYRDFGMVAARLDDLLNLIPARLAGAFLCLAAAFHHAARPQEAWRVMRRDHGNHRSPNSGWPEAAMAGALGLALAGPRRYPGYVADEPWMGAPEGRSEATLIDLRAALGVMVLACVLQAVGLLVLFKLS